MRAGALPARTASTPNHDPALILHLHLDPQWLRRFKKAVQKISQFKPSTSALTLNPNPHQPAPTLRQHTHGGGHLRSGSGVNLSSPPPKLDPGSQPAPTGADISDGAITVVGLYLRLGSCVHSSGMEPRTMT